MGLKKLLTQSIIWRSFYFFSVLLVNIFLSRYLQAAGTGNLYFLTVIFSFTQVVLSLGGESGVIYFASGNIIERNKLISLSAAWSFVAGIVMVIFVYLYFLINTSADKFFLSWYCAFGFLYVGGQLLANYSVAIYYTKENYFLPNFLLAIVNIVFVLIIPGKNAHASLVQVQEITCLFFATFFVGGVLVFLSYIIQYKNEGALSFPNRTNFKKLIRYSATALGANAVFFLVYKIDYFFVNYSPVCTAADLGNYIQVSKIGQLLLTVPQIIASVVFPRTASGIDQKTLSNTIMTIARLFSQLFLLIFIVVAVAGTQLFTAVFGESFNKMQLPMLILIPGIFSLSILALLSAHFAGKGKIKINLYGAIIGLVVMISGDFIFVPHYGIIAAAAISTLSYMANVGYSMWHFYKGYSIHWLEFFKWKKTDYSTLFSMLKFNTPS
jgi:O-antigen/teichoic acid export membrane protein